MEYYLFGGFSSIYLMVVGICAIITASLACSVLLKRSTAEAGCSQVSVQICRKVCRCIAWTVQTTLSEPSDQQSGINCLSALLKKYHCGVLQSSTLFP